MFLHSEDQKLQMLLRLIQEPRKRQALADVPTSNSQENRSLIDVMEGNLSKGSVIIYVWRKKDAEIITEQLLGSGLSGGVVCYHGGMDAGARARAQSKFMRDKARICVATVAFGLGINKPNVKAVVHLCLPSSPENYLQEIGRAGRDGSKAQAIALVAENETAKKHSLSFSNKISRSQVNTFLLILQHLTKEAINDLPVNSDDTISLNIALALDPITKTVDIKEETILTILSMLEDDTLKSSKILDIHGIIPDIVTATLKLRSLEDLATTEDVARHILACGTLIDARSQTGGTAMQAGFRAYSFGTVQFSVTRCSRLLGPNAEPRNMYAALRRLQSNGEIELDFSSQSGRSVFLKMNREGLHCFNNENESNSCDSDKCPFGHLRDMICTYFSEQDVNQSNKVIEMQNILQTVSSIRSEEEPSNNSPKSQRLEVFQKMIKNYFENGGDNEINSNCLISQIDKDDIATLRILTGDVLSLYQDKTISNSCDYFPFQVQFASKEYFDYTALLITKILHGIASPSTPALDWYSHYLWGKWKSYYFLTVLSHVTSIISK